MGITKTFNKYGNLEISGSTIQYRLPTEHFSSDSDLEIHRSIKRGIHDNPSGKYLIEPIEVKNSGRYTLINYNVEHYSSLDRLREIAFEDKINYYFSLIDIGLSVENNSLDIVWDRLNFAIDEIEEIVKVMIFKTDYVAIFDNNNLTVFENIRNLIVLSLTDLNEVYALPKRANFIFNTDELSIKFVQEMFALNSLKDLRMLLETVELDLEEENIEEAQVSSPTEKKGFFRKKDITNTETSKKKKVKKEKAVVQRVQSYSTKNNKKKNNRIDKKTKVMLVSIVLLLSFWGISQLILGSGGSKNATYAINPKKEKMATSTYFKDSNKEAVQKSIVRAYRLTYNQNYKDSYKILSSINKRDLSFTDIPMVIEVYYKQNNLAALLDEAPIQDVSNEVIAYLVKIDKLDELPDIATKMKTKNPYIDFETAYLKEDYKTVISLVDSVEINGRKEQQIVNSYIQLNRFDDATKFAQQVGNPDLIKQIEGSNNY